MTGAPEVPAPMRKTKPLVAVLEALLANPTSEHYGYDLQRQTGIRSGVLYPILRRLLESAWVEDGWEDLSDAEGRPPRRYYRLTERGTAAALALLADPD